MKSEKGKTMVYLIQERYNIIDDEKGPSFFDISEETEYCCEPLQKDGDIGFWEDRKIGFPEYEYKCQDSFFDHTREYRYCPYCGAKFEIIFLKPNIRRGKRVQDVEEQVIRVVRNRHIEWEGEDNDNL